ncbi:PAS domain S-box-containing protein [Azospirillum sp. OGB3]|uniref:hybrid sensor histidine kinase/response regulator n=1 Tax=Azospirillum sp. OGB3 TaxID=2587012 RepID=UPI0016068E52|nr:PAS domain-containing hybrid sensor histidine kinase/response regulator [Azospirillum sp. OGB3]MBB3263370.1 PAS domain S-box-containing protein [Azospirillum sp. OGB3]
MREEDVAGGDRRPANSAELRRVFDTIGVAIALLDRQGRIADLNTAMQRAIGCPHDLLIGQPMAGAFVWGGREGAADRFAQAVAAAGRGVLQELTLTGDGTWLDIVLTPLPAEAGGEPAGVVMTAADASRRMAAEAQLRSKEESLRAARDEVARAGQTKVRFLAAASHDLRQPAQSLTLFGAVLAERLSDHPQLPLVQTMNRAVEAMRGLLDALLDVARLDSGSVSPDMAPFAVAEMLERLEADYGPRATAKGLKLRVRPLKAQVRSDAILLERLLRHLLDNAVRYTASGGVLLGCRRRGMMLCIEVADTGVGIPTDKLDEIFEEFVQLGNAERDRSRGLGLGLAVVKRLSHLLGLPVRVRSRPGRGTCFTVEVPLHASWNPNGTERAMPSLDPPGALALIIDDEELILQSLRLVLEQWGWDVLAAASGEEALRQLDGAERLPDVIIADYRLRYGRTGVDAIRDIHAFAGELIPAILLTGDTSPDRIREARRSGFTVLHKPVTLSELSSHLEDARARAAAE